MKLLSLIGAFLLSIMAFSTAIADPHGEAQERLGKTIQESAQIEMAQGDERGIAQEKLGLAIQNAGVLSTRDSLAEAKDQEHLGRLIRDYAVLSYAQGVIQEEMGKTIVGQPLG
jgi:hypothetical protein